MHCLSSLEVRIDLVILLVACEVLEVDRKADPNSVALHKRSLTPVSPLSIGFSVQRPPTRFLSATSGNGNRTSRKPLLSLRCRLVMPLTTHFSLPSCLLKTRTSSNLSTSSKPGFKGTPITSQLVNSTTRDDTTGPLRHPASHRRSIISRINYCICSVGRRGDLV